MNYSIDTSFKIPVKSADQVWHLKDGILQIECRINEHAKLLEYDIEKIGIGSFIELDSFNDKALYEDIRSVLEFEIETYALADDVELTEKAVQFKSKLLEYFEVLEPLKSFQEEK